MSFYNRRAFQPVSNLINAFGNTQPLDVVEYGGQLTAKVSTAVAGTGVIFLAPPGASVNYRLHRFIGNGAAAGPLMIITGTSSGFVYSAVGAIGSSASETTTDNFMGQLVDEGLTLTTFGMTGTGYLTYDIVEFPTIS